MSGERPTDRRHVAVLAGVLLVILAAALVLAKRAPIEHAQMVPVHLQNAHFNPPPPSPPWSDFAARLWADVSAGGWLQQPLWHGWTPAQNGVLLIALLVMLGVAIDWSKPISVRNAERAALLVPGVLLFNVMRFFEVLEDPYYFRLMDLVFGAIVAVSLGFIALSLWRVRHPPSTLWQPRLSKPTLIVMTAVLLGINVSIVLATPPDDAGFYTNLGAQRLRERGKFPYGDPLLTNSAGAGYGPVLYLGHVPFQVILDPHRVNRSQPTRADLLAGQRYLLPPELATQLTTLSFHVIGVAALVTIGATLATAEVGWALAALYCASAYVMGVGGGRETIGGMTFISHIAPPAMSMLAFAFLARPMLAGGLLVAASATVFFPALFFPAWLGFYWDRRQELVKFLAGCVIGTLLIWAPAVLLSTPLEGQGVIGTVVRESVGHHQGTDTYGLSTFGFWGQRGGIRDWFREPFVAGQFTTSPMFLITIGFAAAMFFYARRSRPWQLALLTATIGIISQWSKIHGTGVYVNWYYPFLLIGLLCAVRDRNSAQ